VVVGFCGGGRGVALLVERVEVERVAGQPRGPRLVVR
jgi:hypothetical protein